VQSGRRGYQRMGGAHGLSANRDRACIAALAWAQVVNVDIVQSYFKTDCYLLLYFNENDAANAPYVNVTDPADPNALGPPLEFVSSFSSSQDMLIWQFPCVPVANDALPPVVAATGRPGWYLCQQRMALSNFHTFNLEAFPFDSHLLSIAIESQVRLGPLS
jgi:hypothetical protein